MMYQEFNEFCHPGGLRLRLPERLFVETTSTGFLIRPPDWMERRTPFEITMKLLTGRPPEEQFGKIHQSKSQHIHYGIKKIEGGSGGPTHVLTAWKVCESRYVQLRHSVQVGELSEPDFTLGWLLIEGACC
jgi:hypothetical protein